MNPLASGLQVEGLQVQSFLYRDGDRLVYRAADPALDATFELLEYAPDAPLGRRDEAGGVRARPGQEDVFAAGRRKFLDEARLAGRLDHPALPRVVRVFETGGSVYQLRPWRDDAPLAVRVRRGHSPDPDAVRAALLEAAEGLQRLHDANLLHGAVTPDALRLDAQGQPRLTSLGESAGHGFADESNGMDWRAPEQLDDEGATTGPWTDAWGLAATLFTWLTGQAPPPARQRLDTIEAGGEDPFDRSVLDRFGGLGDALERGLRLDPRSRPASMDDWRDALERVDWRLRMARESGDDGPVERRPWLPVAIAVLVTGLMLAGGWFLFSDREAPLEEWLEDVDLGGERDRGPRVTAPTSEEQARWEAALDADTLLGYRGFLEDFPTSIYATQAQVQIDILDERAWESLSGEDTRSAYSDYLDQFPTGLHQAEAHRRIDAIDAEAARRERERVERERRDNLAWAEARAARSVTSMERYIEAWPAGLHIEEAQRIRRELLDRGNDDQAFEAALSLDTREAFQAYIDAFPRGEHVTAALTAIERLTLAPGKPFRDCPVCPEMRVMPVGAFRQGASDEDPLVLEQERPRRLVNISRPFAAGIYEVTFGQWDACVEAGGCSHRPPDNGWGRGDRPVMMVSWNDAQEYVAWLSERTGQVYRLPSESEWEYFARADTTGPWQGGSPAAVCLVGNVAGAETGFDWQHEDCEDPVPVGTVPVGAFRPNKAGLFDVIGNVAEWTADCMNLSYLDAPTDGSAWSRGICSSHMTRGGSWVTGSRDIRLSSRFNLKNGDRNDFTGFRVVREIDE